MDRPTASLRAIVTIKAIDYLNTPAEALKDIVISELAKELVDIMVREHLIDLRLTSSKDSFQREYTATVILIDKARLKDLLDKEERLNVKENKDATNDSSKESTCSQEG